MFPSCNRFKHHFSSGKKAEAEFKYHLHLSGPLRDLKHSLVRLADAERYRGRRLISTAAPRNLNDLNIEIQTPNPQTNPKILDSTYIGANIGESYTGCSGGH